jgi:hypothetical protein
VNCVGMIRIAQIAPEPGQASAADQVIDQPNLRVVGANDFRPKGTALHRAMQRQFEIGLFCKPAIGALRPLSGNVVTR